MNRKDYISDNLINIRDRLRQAHPLPDSAAAGSGPSDQTAVPSAPAPAPEPVPVPVPVAAAARREADGARARSDLLCRIAHDAAELSAGVETTEHMLRTYQSLRETLSALEEKAGRLSPESEGASFARSVDGLRMEYFRVAGRLDAVRRTAGSASRGGDDRQSGTHLLPTAILAGAILISGLMIAVVVAAVFG